DRAAERGRARGDGRVTRARRRDRAAGRGLRVQPVEVAADAAAALPVDDARRDRRRPLEDDAQGRRALAVREELQRVRRERGGSGRGETGSTGPGGVLAAP